MNTKLNSNDMNTIVETFFVEEIVDLIYDNDKLDKWNELVSTLELEGQSNLVKPEKSPIPFMYLKNGLINVFEILCPRTTDVKSFNVTPIPLEILDLIALSEKEGYFNKIYIRWDDKSPDPVCIGVTEEYEIRKKGTWTKTENTPFFQDELRGNAYIEANDLKDVEVAKNWSADKNYLIGKWGDVKRPLDELKEMAKKRYVEEESAQLKKEIKERQRLLDDIELNAIEKFN
jgi:hypothetical protein